MVPSTVQDITLQSSELLSGNTLRPLNRYSVGETGTGVKWDNGHNFLLLVVSRLSFIYIMDLVTILH